MDNYTFLQALLALTCTISRVGNIEILLTHGVLTFGTLSLKKNLPVHSVSALLVTVVSVLVDLQSVGIGSDPEVILGKEHMRGHPDSQLRSLDR